MESPGINRDPPGIPPGSERPGKGKIPTSVPSESPFSTGISPPSKSNPRIQSWNLGRIPPIQGFTTGLKPLTGVFWDGRGEIFPKSWILFPSGALRPLPAFPSLKSTFGRSKNPWKLNFPLLLGTQKPRQDNFSFLPWILWHRWDLSLNSHLEFLESRLFQQGNSFSIPGKGAVPVLAGICDPEFPPSWF